MALEGTTLLKRRFSAANWNQRLVLYFRNFGQYFPGSCALSTCRNNKLFFPQETPALHLYACHYSVCYRSSFHSRKTEHGTGNWRITDCSHYPLCPGERRVQQKKHIFFKFSLIPSQTDSSSSIIVTCCTCSKVSWDKHIEEDIVSCPDPTFLACKLVISSQLFI